MKEIKQLAKYGNSIDVFSPHSIFISFIFTSCFHSSEFTRIQIIIQSIEIRIRNSSLHLEALRIDEFQGKPLISELLLVLTFENQI